MKKFLEKIPHMLSHIVSIYIFLFLFMYLVIFGMLGLIFKQIEPSSSAQLILGNYTNVISALGASIAAGASTSTHIQTKKLHDKHDDLQQSIDDLHDKVDQINKGE